VEQNIPVAYFPASVDACALYRMFIPYLHMTNSVYLFKYGPLDTREFTGCKVAVVQRQVSENNLVAIKKIRECGLKLVYDLDDDIWNLPAFNPSKKVFDTHAEGFWKCAKEADILTVSTQGLATAARTSFKMNKDILIVPNAVDLNLFAPKDLVRNDDLVVVGWGGSNTHSEDVKDAFTSVCDVLDANSNVRMEIVGAAATDHRYEDMFNKKGQKMRRKVTYPSKITQHPQTRFRQWVPVGEYPNRFTSWGWDIALAPLEDNRFNRSKSNIKMMEAASTKIPCLVSDVQPYREFCELGGDDLKWLLCRTSGDWKKKLHELVNDSSRRDFLGNKAYEVVKKFFDIEIIKQNWLYVFNKVLGLV
jgi:glycosyltransferase involved in cell wall biosynthesis